ncbi:fimbrial protein [Neisseriaceae bacterium TC5R-5]|nr:fimbrial protein [Neisseriaceae bacterium TC5R-5]
MKKMAAAFSLLATVGISTISSIAYAADSGVITFNGLVTASTCEVTNDATGNFTVTLPTVSANNFGAAALATAGPSNFRIGVKNCLPASGNVRAQFVYLAAQTDLTTGQLINNGGIATNVNLQLFNPSNDSVIKPGDAGVATAFPIASDGTGEMIYGVRYIKPTTATPTPGTVISMVNYKLSYN